MPKKTCPKCNAKHGTRKLKCECGHDFSCSRSNRTAYPEPGTWVLDMPKGMPKIVVPPPLTDSLSNSDVRDQVAYEGLGYCVYEFIAPKLIEDRQLRRLWVEARRAMEKVVEYLEQ